MPPELREPWSSFLQELDERLTELLVLHCLGGFVVTTCYGLPRTTADIDVLAVAPGQTLAGAVAIAGESSPLHQRHGVYLDVVTVASLPYEYEDRVIKLPGPWKRLRLSRSIPTISP